MVLLRYALFAGLLVAIPVLADPPKMQPSGTLDAKLGELAEKHITIKRLENELSKWPKPTLVGKEVDYEYDLASDVLFRRQELPKSKNSARANLIRTKNTPSCANRLVPPVTKRIAAISNQAKWFGCSLPRKPRKTAPW